MCTGLVKIPLQRAAVQISEKQQHKVLIAAAFILARNMVLVIVLSLLCTALVSVKGLLSPVSPVVAAGGGVLLLDHLNINHEKGRHDLVRAFYVETLGLVLDERKRENIDKGRKTLWTNAGITQFHLPEADKAQIFDGIVTLSCTDANHECYDALVSRLEAPPDLLANTYFSWLKLTAKSVAVRDPWGTCFLIKHDPTKRDPRGEQPGTGQAGTIGLVMSDLTVNLPRGKTSRDIAGIARFYDHVFKTPVVAKSGRPIDNYDNAHEISLGVSPYQTLTFKLNNNEEEDQGNNIPEKLHAAGDNKLSFPQPHPHEEVVRNEDGKIISNSGPHVSMYIQDFVGTYQRAEKLGSSVLFTNTRFKRQAFTFAEAKEQSMFRVLDIVDPMHPTSEPILRLEHEVRSVLGKDGKSLYKSCPFFEIPSGLVP